MQRPMIKLVKFSRLDMALGCEPGSRKHAPLPGHLKTGYSNGSGLIVIYIIKALNGISYLTIKKRGGTGMHIYIYQWL